MKVGDYVRTKNGDIFKYIKTDEDGKLRRTLSSDSENITTEFELSDVIKSSSNIIDLIEVGDILTIKDIFGNLSKVEVDENFKLLTGRIISIVTKEQFKQMEYKIGGSDV